MSTRLTPHWSLVLDRDPAPVALALAAEFEPSSHAAWRALVEKTLKGGSPEDLAWLGYDGLKTQALYTAETAAAAAPLPAAVRSQGADRWDVRVTVDHPDPVAANAQALSELESGASSLLLRLDPTGAAGVAIGGVEAMARTLSGVVLELAPVALDAGWLGCQAARWLHGAASSAPRAKLALHLDPLGAFALSGTSPGPVQAHIAEAARLGAALAPVYPDATLFLANGRAAYEAGATEAQELAMTAASGVAYVRALMQAGLTAGEALQRIVVGLSADGEGFATLAKIRAARAIWGRLAGAFGAEAPIRIEARSAHRMLSRRDPWVNLLRLTVAGFGAAVGGADALVLEPFTGALAEGPSQRPDAFARRQARNAQLVLMEESGLARVEDPAAGAWFLEAQSDQLARAGWAGLQAIERQGGPVAALRSGTIAAQIAAVREARAADIASGRRDLIGVTAFSNGGEAVRGEAGRGEAGRDEAGRGEATAAVETVDAAPFAVAPPDVRLPGADDACPPLVSWRSAAAHEADDIP